MKANELMIGDWVIDGTQPAQVTGITCGGVIETTANEHSNIEVIEPIRITPELLEANGFEIGYKCPEGVYSLYVDGTIVVEVALYDPFFINISYEEITPDGTDSGTISTFCKVHGEEIYVHELQNFLRLYNIDIDLVL